MGRDWGHPGSPGSLAAALVSRTAISGSSAESMSAHIASIPMEPAHRWVSFRRASETDLAVRGREIADSGTLDRTQPVLPMRPGQAERRTGCRVRRLFISPPAPGPVEGDPLEEAQRHADALRDEVAAAPDRLRQQDSAVSAAYARLAESARPATAVERELQISS